MKLTTTQTQKTEIEIPVPCFYKYNGVSGSIIQLIGVPDEKTILQVWESEKRTYVENSDVDSWQSKLIDAHLNWQPITEDEFMYHYNRALRSMSMTPELIENPNPVL